MKPTMPCTTLLAQVAVPPDTSAALLKQSGPVSNDSTYSSLPTLTTNIGQLSSTQAGVHNASSKVLQSLECNTMLPPGVPASTHSSLEGTMLGPSQGYLSSGVADPHRAASLFETDGASPGSAGPPPQDGQRPSCQSHSLRSSCGPSRLSDVTGPKSSLSLGGAAHLNASAASKKKSAAGMAPQPPTCMKDVQQEVHWDQPTAFAEDGNPLLTSPLMALHNNR